MSYDCRFCVREWISGRFVTVDYPELDSPTYNLRPIFAKALELDYSSEEAYPLEAMVDRFDKAIKRIRIDEDGYRKLEPANKWGTLEQAIECLEDWSREGHELLEDWPEGALYWSFFCLSKDMRIGEA